jgi:hypothetical protein
LVLENQAYASIGGRIESNVNKPLMLEKCSVVLDPLKPNLIGGTSFQQTQVSAQHYCATPLSFNGWSASRLDLMEREGVSIPALDNGIYRSQISASHAGTGTTPFLPAMRTLSSLFNANTPFESSGMRNIPSSSTFLPGDTMLPHCSPNLQLPFPAILLPPPPFLSPDVPPLALLHCLHRL